VGRKTLLTQEAGEKILEALRRGCSDTVAAEGAGIGRRTFYDWLARGEAGEGPFEVFLEMVLKARAEARGAAEIAVHDKQPLAWLLRSPGGRETADAPGWGQPARPGAAGERGEVEQGVEQALGEVETPGAGGGQDGDRSRGGGGREDRGQVDGGGEDGLGKRRG
jgi:hypothetical protein